MDEPPEAHPPLCRAEEASEQVEAVVRFILDQHGLGSLSLIAHSWGSLPAGRLAGRHPRLIDQVVLFAPIARRPPRRSLRRVGQRYLESDPDSARHDPVGVKVPTGPLTDILHAWHGDLAYDPALVKAPVAIIRGAWDGVVPDGDALWLFDAFASSPVARDIKISGGTLTSRASRRSAPAIRMLSRPSYKCTARVEDVRI